MASHEFVKCRFSKPTLCQVCSAFAWGAEKQLMCKRCFYAVHKMCRDGATDVCFHRRGTSGRGAAGETGSLDSLERKLDGDGSAAAGSVDGGGGGPAAMVAPAGAVALRQGAADDADFELGRELGRGRQSVVYEATERATGQKWAVKRTTIAGDSRRRGRGSESPSSKSKAAHTQQRMMAREIALLSRLRHPNIVQMAAAYHSAEHVDLVLELCAGGELFEQLVLRSSFSEQDAQSIMRQMVDAVRYLHSLGVVHRDIKAENILLLKAPPLPPADGSAGPPVEFHVKLADFSLSNMASPTGLLQTVVGTPQWVSPDVLSGQPYTAAVDNWALGCLAYVLLSGTPPFWGESQKELFDRVMEARYSFDEADWADVSVTARNFIALLLVRNSEYRATANEAAAHPWLNADAVAAAPSEVHDAKAVKNLRDYYGHMKGEGTVGRAYVPRSVRANSQLSLDEAAIANKSDGGAGHVPPPKGKSIEEAEEGKKNEATTTKSATGDGGVQSYYSPGRTEEVYEIRQEVGRGGCARVYEAVHRKTGQRWAIKRLEKRGFEQRLLDRELSIIRRLKHPNILQFGEAFETPLYVDLVVELVDGGELFDQVVARGGLDEADAARIVGQIFDGLIYMHDLGIAHRDLKAENILVFADMQRCVIADFGLSNVLEQAAGRLETSCGTPDYVAPEILMGEGYSTGVDIWSCGVLTYIMLCGFPPFFDKSSHGLFRRILAGAFDFPSPEWDDMSPESIHFVRHLLITDPAKRPTAREARGHVWLSERFHERRTPAADHGRSLYNLMEYNAKRNDQRLIKPTKQQPARPADAAAAAAAADSVGAGKPPDDDNKAVATRPRRPSKGVVPPDIVIAHVPAPEAAAAADTLAAQAAAAAQAEAEARAASANRQLYAEGRLEDRWELGELLGRGTVSKVYECRARGELAKRVGGRTFKRDADMQWVVKRLDKRLIERKLLERELAVMQQLDHPSLLRCREAFESEFTVDLVVERAAHGELFDVIVERAGFDENDARHVVRQVLEGVSYLHKQGIAHRDLKAENLKLADPDSLTVKISDFGLSNVLGAAGQLQTSVGSIDYVPPEILKGEPYNQAVDIWAVGVLTYILLVGYPPFFDEAGEAGLFKKIMAVDYNFDEEEWKSVSGAAKHFIAHLLVENPTARYSANQALGHPWLRPKSKRRGGGGGGGGGGGSDSSVKPAESPSSKGGLLTGPSPRLKSLPSMSRLEDYHKNRKNERKQGREEARRLREKERQAKEKRRAEKAARRAARDHARGKPADEGTGSVSSAAAAAADGDDDEKGRPRSARGLTSRSQQASSSAERLVGAGTASSADLGRSPRRASRTSDAVPVAAAGGASSGSSGRGRDRASRRSRTLEGGASSSSAERFSDADLNAVAAGERAASPGSSEDRLGGSGGGSSRATATAPAPSSSSSRRHRPRSSAAMSSAVVASDDQQQQQHHHHRHSSTSDRKEKRRSKKKSELAEN